MGTLEARERVEVGDKVRIVEFGSKDSWALAVANNDPSPLGLVGTLIEINPHPLASEGYLTCMIHLDKPFMNYLVRISLFEAKLERITDCG